MLTNASPIVTNWQLCLTKFCPCFCWSVAATTAPWKITRVRVSQFLMCGNTRHTRYSRWCNLVCVRNMSVYAWGRFLQRDKTCVTRAHGLIVALCFWCCGFVVNCICRDVWQVLLGSLHFTWQRQKSQRINVHMFAFWTSHSTSIWFDVKGLCEKNMFVCMHNTSCQRVQQVVIFWLKIIFKFKDW